MAKRKRKTKKPTRAPSGMVFVDVASPYGAEGGRDRVLRRISADPLSWLESRGKLNIQQVKAGRQYEWAYHAMQGQTNMSIDYGRERVDTSGITQPTPDAQLQASDTIKQVVKALGRHDSYMVQLVCGEGWKIKDYVMNVHGASESHPRHSAKWTQHFADVLTKLAILWGYESRRAA